VSDGNTDVDVFGVHPTEAGFSEIVELIAAFPPSAGLAGSKTVSIDLYWRNAMGPHPASIVNNKRLQVVVPLCEIASYSSTSYALVVDMINWGLGPFGLSALASPAM
jgi:hypothetical protein